MAYTDIDKPSDYFNTVLYTGDASSPRTISGVGFQPDWNWSKSRNSADYDHNVADSVRGGSAYYLKTNTAAAETGNPAAGYVSSFNSDGYVLTAGGGDNTNYNNNNTTYVSWNWKAGTSFTNDASGTGIGSIDSAGSVSDVSGFSICSYTGTGSNGTVKHGLSTAPKIIFFKALERSDLDWNIGCDMLGYDKFINVNTNSAEQTHNLFQGTAPTTSVFYLSGDAGVNESSKTYIAYCLAEKSGYSSIGQYTGNGTGNSGGPFIYTGFKPAWVMIKNSSASSTDWIIYDNKRGGPASGVYGNNNKFFLRANTSAVEANETFDMYSNGFKIKITNNFLNGSGNKLIYMAFAENPFVTSTGVPATAR